MTYQFYNYWLILCAIMIWLPTVMMLSSYTLIWFKLRESSKAFPYLSQQSRIARSRRRVIHMLFVLIIIELICWGPWQFFIIAKTVIHRSKDERDPEVKHFMNSLPYLKYYYVTDFFFVTFVSVVEKDQDYFD